MCEGDYIWNSATYNGKNSKYLPSIIDDSVIIWDEIIEETKTGPANLLEKKQPVKQNISVFYFPF